MRLPLRAGEAGCEPGVRVLDDGRAGSELGQVGLSRGQRLGQESGVNMGTGVAEIRRRGETFKLELSLVSLKYLTAT